MNRFLISEEVRTHCLQAIEFTMEEQRAVLRSGAVDAGARHLVDNSLSAFNLTKDMLMHATRIPGGPGMFVQPEFVQRILDTIDEPPPEFCTCEGDDTGRVVKVCSDCFNYKPLRGLLADMRGVLESIK